MKLRKLFAAIALPLALGVIGTLSFGTKDAIETKADQTYTYPRNGQTNTVMLVGGSLIADCDIAVYCWNGSGSAWTKGSVMGGYRRIVLPSLNGSSTTWSQFIVCRYDPSKNPFVDGSSGIWEQTEDIYFSSFIQAQNTVILTGRDGGKMTHNMNAVYLNGIAGERHMYLDLSSFTSWEEGNAKFAIYFAYPQSGNAERWSTKYSAASSYEEAFCWKVNGQDNDHLYECIVPNTFSSGSTIWSLVIAVRYNPVAGAPSWNDVWNQSNDIVFTNENHDANMIRITDWNSGYVDKDNVISMASRADFYGQYFLDTVKCSETGATDATTSAQWQAVKDEYDNHLSRLAQGEVWKAKPDEEGSLVEQAVLRYDYIVFFKGYSHADFMNRAESPNKGFSSGAYNVQTSSGSMTNLIILVTFASMAVLAGAMMVYAAKRRRISKR